MASDFSEVILMLNDKAGIVSKFYWKGSSTWKLIFHQTIKQGRHNKENFRHAQIPTYTIFPGRSYKELVNQ